MTEELKALYDKAEELAGRPVEVETLKDGQLIVLWMRFETSPPTPAATEKEALENFISKMLQLAQTDATI